MALLNPFRIGQGVLGQQLGPYPYATLGADKVPYWDGNQMVIPQFTPKPWMYAPLPQSAAAPLDPNQPSSQVNAGILSAMYGDGAQGEGFSGGRADPTGSGTQAAPAPNTSSPANANPAATQAAQAGIPSLSEPKEQTAPSAPTAPAPGLSPADQGMKDMRDKGLIGEMQDKGLTTQGKPGIGPSFSDSKLGAQAAAQAATQAAQAAATASAVPGLPDPLGAIDTKTPSEQNATATKGSVNDSDYGGMSDNGETGSTGSPAGNTGATDPGQDNTGGHGAGGIWRKGGFVGDDGDNKLEPRKGILHEREFVMNPEMTKALETHAPGLLHKMDRMQKKLMRYSMAR